MHLRSINRDSRLGKKLKKILIIAAILTALFCTTLIILFRNVDKILVKEIKKKIDCEIYYENFRFNPFTGFNIDNIRIKLPADSLPQSIEKISLSYHFWSLFKKQLLITGLKITSPEFQLTEYPESGWNFLSAMKTDSTASMKKETESKEFKLPVVIKLNRLAIENLSAAIKTGDVGINLTAGDYFVTDLVFNSPDDFSASIELKDILSKVKAGMIDEAFRLNTNLKVSGLDSNIVFNTEGGFELRAPGDKYYPSLKFAFEGSFNPFKQAAKIDSFSVKASENKSGIDISGKLSFINHHRIPEFALNMRINEFSYVPKCWMQRIASKYIEDLPQFSYKQESPSDIEVSGAYNIPEESLNADLKLNHSGIISGLIIKDSGKLIDKASLSILADLSMYGGVLDLKNFNLQIGDFSASKFDLACRNIGVEMSGSLQYSGDKLSVEHLILDSEVKSPQYKTFSKYIDIENIRSQFVFTDSEVSGEFRADIADNSVFQGGILLRNYLDKLQNFKIESDILDSLWFNVSSFELKYLSQGYFTGKINSSGAFYKSGEVFRLRGDVIKEGEAFVHYRDETFAAPMDTFRYASNIKVSDDFKTISLNKLNIDISGWLNSEYTVNIANFDSAAIEIVEFSLDIGKILDIEGISRLSPVRTDAIIEMTGKIDLDIQNPTSPSVELIIISHNFSAEMDTSVILRGIELNLSALLADNKLSIDNRTKIAEIEIPALRTVPIKNVEVKLQGNVSLINLNPVFSASLVLPNENLDFAAEGFSYFKDEKLHLEMNLTSNFSDTGGAEIVPGIILKGDLHSMFQTVYDSALVLDGSVVFDDFSLSTPFFNIDGVGGDVPFKQTIDLKDMTYSKSVNLQNPLYFESRPYRRMAGYPVENVVVRKINAFDRDITDIKADVFWQDGMFNLPYFHVAIFEGNMIGGGYASIDSLTIGKISYGIKAQGAEINSAQISQLKTSGQEASKISFNLNFKGKGIDPSADDFDLEGAVHITKLSPKVAENLLYALDPQQKDKGIQSMLYFLKRGWGVKSFSFELAHGFVYSTILTQQPPFTKPIPFTISKLLPIEKEIRLSRLPLKFFL